VASLSLKKTLTGRYNLCLALSKKALKDRNLIFVYGILLHIIKSCVEIVVIGTGLGFKFLRHRMGTPIEATDIAQWRKIWSQCSCEELSA
jgi:hypothetical protein